MSTRQAPLRGRMQDRPTWPEEDLRTSGRQRQTELFGASPAGSQWTSRGRTSPIPGHEAVEQRPRSRGSSTADRAARSTCSHCLPGWLRPHQAAPARRTRRHFCKAVSRTGLPQPFAAALAGGCVRQLSARRSSQGVATLPMPAHRWLEFSGFHPARALKPPATW
jgi:hypothetical protein